MNLRYSTLNNHDSLTSKTVKAASMAAITLILSMSQISNAGVLSLKPIQNTTEGDTATNAIRVQCDARAQQPVMVKAGKDAQWCDSILSSYCHADRITAAEKLCSPSYAKALKRKDAAPEKLEVPKEEQLQAELFEIEQSLISLQQKRIALRKRELDLLAQKHSNLVSAKN